MNKYYNTPERATVYAGRTSITVYGDTARFVNIVVVATVAVAAITLLYKLLK